MPKFTDTEGAVWQLQLNAWTLKRVNELTGVLLTKLIDKNFELLIALESDDLLLVSVLYAMCEDQIKERQLSEQDFAMALAGSCLGEAFEALIEATTDFFRDPATREGVRRIMQLIKASGKTEKEKALATIDRITAARTTGGSSFSSPESAASTPGATV